MPCQHGEQVFQSIHSTSSLLLIPPPALSSSCTFCAPAWGASCRRQPFTDFSNMRPSYRMQIFRNASAQALSAGDSPSGAHCCRMAPISIRPEVQLGAETESLLQVLEHLLPSSSTDRGVSRLVPLTHSHFFLTAAVKLLFSTFLNVLSQSFPNSTVWLSFGQQLVHLGIDWHWLCPTQSASGIF